VAPKEIDAMHKAGLSHRRIEAASAPPGKRVRLSDFPASPLVLVVSGDSSHKAWACRPRVAGRSCTLTLGKYPAVSLQVARERARAVERAIAEGNTAQAALRAIARGADPSRPAARPVDTVAAVAEAFVARHLHGRHRSAAYVRNVEGRFRNHILPALGPRDIRSVTRREIIELLDRVHDRNGPGAANLTLATLSSLFRWARQRDLVETLPVEGVVKPGTENRRERVLDDRELTLLMRAARRVGYPSGAFLQFLVLTGLRRTEAARLCWDEVDIEGASITISAERMKGRRAHIVPLAPATLALLQHCPRQGRFVFSVFGTHPLSDFDKYKRGADALISEIAGAPLLPWRLHDLRRSCATGMARIGVPRFIVARVLAHADREVTGIYDRYEYLTEKRAALERWAQHIAGLLQPQPVPETGAAHGHGHGHVRPASPGSGRKRPEAAHGHGR
jgi:integrase